MSSRASGVLENLAPDHSRRVGLLLVLPAAASWGTWSLFLRPTHLPATVTTPIVFLAMGLVALPFALRGPPVRWDRTTLGLVVANAAFDAINLVLFFAAMQRTTVAIAVLTHYFAPIFVALVAPRIDGIATRGAGPAAAVAVAGLAIILEPWRSAGGDALLGALLGTGSAICFAGNTLTVRKLAMRIGPTRALSYHSLIAGIGLFPLAIGQLGAVTPGALALLVTGSATIGAAAGIVFTIGLTRIGSARAAILTFIEPIVAVALGVIVWGEPLHPTAMIGGALVLGAGVQVVRKAR